MTPEEMIAAAQDALGRASSGDYKIQPANHAQELEAKAPALAALLRSSELSVLAEQYEKKDKEATENQAVFKTTASRANWAVLLTACFSTLLLIVGPTKSVAGVSVPNVLAIVGVCGVISGALGSMWVYRAREGKLLDNWMTARAAAEMLRRQYFEAVTSFVAPGNVSPIAPALLQFEYFRRYQLDVQIAFFQSRAADHRRDANRLLSLGAGSVALASIGAGLAAVLSGINPSWVAIAALGTVATALASFASTKESVNQSRQNAERYTNTCDALTLVNESL
jgi:hypothetical protein